MYTVHLQWRITILPNLELKTQSKQLLGSFPLDIALPVLMIASLTTLLGKDNLLWFVTL
jgi:hypothetical protein